MPSYRTTKNYTKPWHARAKREGLEWSLGMFVTREEAVAAEKAFTIPKLVNQVGKHQR